MNRTSFVVAPARVGTLFALAIVMGQFACVSSALGQGNNVLRVEEDWELVLTEPDSLTVAPQVTTTMSPNNHLNGTYWTFEINHLTAPAFSPGGVHLHQWNGESRQSTYSRADRSVMHTLNETMTWTQSLHSLNGNLTFEVRDGVSTTWGTFGFGNFKLTSPWNSTHLNNYSPEVSVANAGVGFAANRVASLKLKRVRVTYSTGQTLTDETERVVVQQ
jgi:hypothetical protein